MPREVLEKKPITIAEAMASLRQRSEESELSYWQRVAFEHAMHHARIEPQESRKIVVKLTKDFGISELSAFTIANILPTTQEELKDLLQKDLRGSNPRESFRNFLRNKHFLTKI